MDRSSFTKGYFLNREALVAVLLLIDASVLPQKIDLDCANWLGRNNVSFSLTVNCLDNFLICITRLPAPVYISVCSLFSAIPMCFRYQWLLFSQSVTKWRGEREKGVLRISGIFRSWSGKTISNILHGSWLVLSLVWAEMSFSYTCPS